jgi:hypothetical protein
LGRPGLSSRKHTVFQVHHGEEDMLAVTSLSAPPLLRGADAVTRAPLMFSGPQDMLKVGAQGHIKILPTPLC